MQHVKEHETNYLEHRIKVELGMPFLSTQPKIYRLYTYKEVVGAHFFAGNMEIRIQFPYFTMLD
jgi:hypothetical protein